MSDVQCPHCDGFGANAAFIRHANGEGSYDPALRCDLCSGTGTVSRQTINWLSVGRTHRDARVGRGESVMECARRLGLTPAALSAMEHGRADPARLKAGLDE